MAFFSGRFQVDRSIGFWGGVWSPAHRAVRTWRSCRCPRLSSLKGFRKGLDGSSVRGLTFGHRGGQGATCHTFPARVTRCPGPFLFRTVFVLLEVLRPRSRCLDAVPGPESRLSCPESGQLTSRLACRPRAGCPRPWHCRSRPGTGVPRATAVLPAVLMTGGPWAWGAITAVSPCVPGQSRPRFPEPFWFRGDLHTVNYAAFRVQFSAF